MALEVNDGGALKAVGIVTPVPNDGSTLPPARTAGVERVDGVSPGQLDIILLEPIGEDEFIGMATAQGGAANGRTVNVVWVDETTIRLEGKTVGDNFDSFPMWFMFWRYPGGTPARTPAPPA